ncbi:MAG: UDP-N-acetylmuramoyl-L-alanyl-D-glutamate--2,6-diaminopimelate ligase [Candidatus Sericytochromatia bacterium]
MKLQTLLRGLDTPPLDANPEIGRICYDSRHLEPGDLYIAQPGTRVDGHAFVQQAVIQGAAAIVCAADWYREQTDLPEAVWVPVPDTRVALAALAANYHDRPADRLQMIGVTGTNGKTTITQLISQALDRLRRPCGYIGTLGAGYAGVLLPGAYTTPFPPELHEILGEMLSQGVQAVAMECSSHALHQHRLDQIDFQAAVFTNLTQDHLDYHGNMQAYAEAKALLFSKLLKPTGTAILNAADPHWELFARASRAPVLSYGVETDADIQARDLVFDPEGVAFTLSVHGQLRPWRIRLPGRYNVANALAALAVCLSQGFHLDIILSLIGQMAGVAGRLERVSPDGHPFAVYVDYAHTPDSLDNALQAVRQFTQGQVRVVFGCGGDRDRSKRPLMGAVAERLADRVIVTSDNPRSENPDTIIQSILSGLQSPYQAAVEPDRRQAIALALAEAQPGDVVLLAGKGHETYQLIGDQTLHFDDREEARALLERK